MIVTGGRTPSALYTGIQKPVMASQAHVISAPQHPQPIDPIMFLGLKSPKDSRARLRSPVYPEMVDERGNIKAGHVLRLIDIAGSMPGFRHVGENRPFVTASVDRTNFISPVRRWEFIRLDSRLTRIWGTSLETEVKVYADNLRKKEARHVATAHLVFVALPVNGKKEKLPPLGIRTFEDHQLAQAADIRKVNRQTENKSTPIISITDEDKPVVISELMEDKHSNMLNRVFGGEVLRMIDEAGSQAAKRQAGDDGYVTGVRLDRMNFEAPTLIGETLHAKAIVTKTWRTSMEVQVQVEAENKVTGERREVANSYLVYIKLDKNGVKTPVPPWVPQTALQKKRAEDADKRKQIRQQEEEQIHQPTLSPPSVMERLRFVWNTAVDFLKAVWQNLRQQIRYVFKLFQKD